MSLLTETQISEELATVPRWTRDGSSIATVTERADFRDALFYLGAVAYLAETASHHPDITINWKYPLGRRPHRQRLRPRPPDLRALKERRAPHETLRRPEPGAGRSAAPVRHLL